MSVFSLPECWLVIEALIIQTNTTKITQTPLFWVLLLFLGMAGTGFCAWCFELRTAELAEFGLTVKIPDLTHLMTPAYLGYFSWELGEVGRAFYIQSQIRLDSLAIISYLMLLISLAHFFALGSVQTLLIRGVFLAGFFDLTENILVIAAVSKYPEMLWLATPITICTSLKAFFLVVTGCILIPLSILGTIEKLKTFLKTLSKKRA